MAKESKAMFPDYLALHNKIENLEYQEAKTRKEFNEYRKALGIAITAENAGKLIDLGNLEKKFGEQLKEAKEAMNGYNQMLVELFQTFLKGKSVRCKGYFYPDPAQNGVPVEQEVRFELSDGDLEVTFANSGNKI